MKRNQEFQGLVENVKFPNRGIVKLGDKPIIVKGSITGQKVQARVTKRRSNRCEARLLSVIEKAPHEVEPFCQYFGPDGCGGCAIQQLSYEDQLSRKERQVKELFEEANIKDYIWKGISPSPEIHGYRNKMEYSFGDAYKDGPLALGMHKKGARFDIVTVDGCFLVDRDFSMVLKYILDYCQKEELSFYHKMNRQGYLRYLVVRKSKSTGDLLVNLVTTTQESHSWDSLVKGLRELDLEGQVSGFIHTTSDSLSDAVKPEGADLLYGVDYIREEVLGLDFNISPYSFFQTNTKGSEILYQKVIEMAGNIDEKTVFDLYCGTGTITQIMASAAKKVYGIEIVEEAVEAAIGNAKLNGLTNCHFIGGDVLKEIENLKEKPDLIILDPPRAGIHPKAIGKIIEFGAPEIVYVSCNPRALVRDLQLMIKSGYQVEEAQCVDMFPHTNHVETIALIQKKTT